MRWVSDGSSFIYMWLSCNRDELNTYKDILTFFFWGTDTLKLKSTKKKINREAYIGNKCLHDTIDKLVVFIKSCSRDGLDCMCSIRSKTSLEGKFHLFGIKCYSVYSRLWCVFLLKKALKSHLCVNCLWWNLAMYQLVVWTS